MTLDAKLTPKGRVNRKAGQIIPRGERTWLVRIFLGDPETKKRKYESQTVHGTKKDAQAKLNGLLRDWDLGIHASVQHTPMGALVR